MLSRCFSVCFMTKNLSFTIIAHLPSNIMFYFIWLFINSLYYQLVYFLIYFIVTCMLSRYCVCFITNNLSFTIIAHLPSNIMFYFIWLFINSLYYQLVYFTSFSAMITPPVPTTRPVSNLFKTSLKPV